MIITKDKTNFVFKTRIDFTVDGQDEFVELRELTTAEQNAVFTAGKINADGEFEDLIGMLTQAEKFFAKCVTDHSGVNENGEKCSSVELYDTLKQSSSVFQQILNTWISSKRLDLSVKKSEGGNPLA